MAKTFEDRIREQQVIARELSGIQLYNEDGSLNLAGARAVLNDPAYSTWRQRFPELLDQIQSSVNQEQRSAGIKVADTVGKLGFSLAQIRRANKQQRQAPQFPDRQDSKSEIAQAYQRSLDNAGLSARQRGLTQQQLDRNNQANRRQLIEASGGQGGAVQAGIQALNQQAINQNSQLLQADQQMRTQSQNRSDRLLGQLIAENNRSNQFAQNRFNRRDFPLNRFRNAATERLLSTGLSNAFAGGTALGNQIDYYTRRFGHNMPGLTVRDNSFFNNGNQSTKANLIASLNQPFQSGAQLLMVNPPQQQPQQSLAPLLMASPIDNQQITNSDISPLLTDLLLDE